MSSLREGGGRETNTTVSILKAKELKEGSLLEANVKATMDDMKKEISACRSP